MVRYTTSATNDADVHDWIKFMVYTLVSSNHYSRLFLLDSSSHKDGMYAHVIGDHASKKQVKEVE